MGRRNGRGAGQSLPLDDRRTSASVATSSPCPVELWTSPSDRRAPGGPWGQPVDNAKALPTACPHSRASRPRTPQDH